jgi:biofilm PGA synthesis lipoprotein PgaB
MYRQLRKTAVVGMLVALALALQACSSTTPSSFVPPEHRPVAVSGQAWPRNHVLVLAYHDVQDNNADQTFITVRTPHLVQHLAWLRDNGYHPVSVDQILQARSGGPDLPEKAVLLTFDDGYTSFRTRVQAYGWPAVLAVVGTWADGPPGEPIDFGGKPVTRDHFLDWPALREIADSGLVEIASHSNNLHYGITGNPQGNTQPAAATRLYDARNGTYESDQAYEARIRHDVESISKKLRRVSGKAPRVWVWPYGEANGQAIREIKRQGYQLIMTLDWGLADIGHTDDMPRLLVSDDPDAATFANTVLSMEEQGLMRVVQVRLDDVYDPDPEKLDRNLGALVQRIADLKVNTVFLQADSAAAGDGEPNAVYFPNHRLPMKADLFNRAAWQLRTRGGVKVYALLGGLEHASRQDQQALYEDLARYTNFAGVVFDDSLPEELTGHLAVQVRAIRGPQVRLALLHRLAADAMNTPQRMQQALGDFLTRAQGAYDRAVIDLPLATGSATPVNAMIDSVVATVASRPGALAQTVFTVASSGENTLNPAPATHAPAHDYSPELARALLRLQLRGAASVGYSHDDFTNDQPRLARIRPVLSTAWYPYK